jgi:acetyl-CoA C-acetyltransferase
VRKEAQIMPEAVIVATARSPIGRAFKGSMTSIRPDDLLAQMVSSSSAADCPAASRGSTSPG